VNRTIALCMFFVGFGVLAQDSLRLLPHVPPPRTLFDAWVYLGNQTANPQAFELLGFRTDGTQLPLASGELAPGEVRRLKSTDLFEDPAPSHFFVRGEIDATLEYRSPFSEQLSLFLPEQTLTGDQFRLYCQSWDDVFVGVVVVNLGNNPATMMLHQTHFSGEVQKTEILVENLPVLGKAVFTLGDFLDEAASSLSCSLTLESDQPVMLQIFKGNVPVRDDGSLEVLIPAITRISLPTATPWDN